MAHRSPVWLVTAVGLLAVLAAPSFPGRAAPAREERGCTVYGDKVASPARVLLGESVQVRLTLHADCPPAVLEPADIVMAIDRSVSMAQDGKMDAAKSAARSFTAATDLSLHRIGVVSFAGTAQLVIGLSQDRAAIETAVNGIGIAPSTNISAALDMSAQLLRRDGRPEARWVIILISDGSPNQPMPDPRTAAIRSANFAKIDGMRVFAIGLGRDADPPLLQSLASGSDHYWFAPGAEDLVAIYESIAVVIASSAVSDVVVEDDLAPDVTLIGGSPTPTAEVAGSRLTWRAATLPSGGLSFVYEVEGNRAGTYPTNARAVATFRNADGSAGQFTFPQPQITVVDPNEGVPCSDPNAWSVLVHAFPDAIGRSPSGGAGCNNRFDSGDWFGGTWPGLPPLEFQLTDAGGTKTLYRGRSVPGPGRVDQRLLIRACDPPPYRLRLLNEDLHGYLLCPNSPAEQLVTARAYARSPFRSTEVRFGFTVPGR